MLDGKYRPKKVKGSTLWIEGLDRTRELTEPVKIARWLQYVIGKTQGNFMFSLKYSIINK